MLLFSSTSEGLKVWLWWSDSLRHTALAKPMSLASQNEKPETVRVQKNNNKIYSVSPCLRLFKEIQKDPNKKNIIHHHSHKTLQFSSLQIFHPALFKRLGLGLRPVQWAPQPALQLRVGAAALLERSVATAQASRGNGLGAEVLVGDGQVLCKMVVKALNLQ